MKIVLHDALSVIRAMLEVAPSRFDIRQFLLKIDHSPDTDIFVWDGAKAKKTRQTIYPNYKAQRKPMGESIFEGLKLVKEAMLQTKAIHVEVGGYEGDDVIAALAKKYGKQHYAVHINTRDYDLRALVTAGPKVTCSVPAKPHVADEHIRLYKATVGDPSDAIPGIKGFGDKSWEAVANKAVLKNMFEHIDRGIRLSVEELSEFMSPASAKWVVENRRDMLAMYVCVGFLPVDPLLIDRATRVGRSDPSARDSKLQEFFL